MSVGVLEAQCILKRDENINFKQLKLLHRCVVFACHQKRSQESEIRHFAGSDFFCVMNE